jgi:hypothetical protein
MIDIPGAHITLHMITHLPAKLTLTVGAVEYIMINMTLLMNAVTTNVTGTPGKEVLMIANILGVGVNLPRQYLTVVLQANTETAIIAMIATENLTMVDRLVWPRWRTVRIHESSRTATVTPSAQLEALSLENQLRLQ